ncbi:MAG: Rpn family recombination-promoting nuclease/putative transposase [Lactobacillales bacterium]|jgi:predicted transposase/invertase (TIGR01784 family)|nr:Rpn family recombination-promoting nuclease/putative transposase [Lactobacillales bacterium]
MKEKPAMPQNDLVFKKLFADEKNKDILIDFIRDITRLKVADVEHVMNPYNVRNYQSELDEVGDDDYGFTIVDLKVKLINGETVIVEMQNAREENFVKRLMYYGATSFVESYHHKYAEIKAVHVIALMDFKLDFKDDVSNLKSFKMTDEFGNELEDLVQIHLVELKKIKPDDPNGNLLRFMVKFFTEGIVAKGAPRWLAKIGDRYRHLNFTKEEKKLISRAERNRADIEDSKLYYTNRGIERGKRNIISNLVDSGMSIEQIALLTKLSNEQVEKILEVGGKEID